MMGKSGRVILIVVAVAVSVGACAVWWRPRPDVTAALAVPRLPRIRPDYSGITVPPNIAPLNFSIRERGSRFLVQVTAEAGGSIEIVSRTPKIAIPADDWRELLDANRGKELRFVVHAEQDKRWQRYEPIVNRVAGDDIDGYIAYRLIEPVHTTWHQIAVHQRDLTTYRESVVLDGMSFGKSCVNCHSFANNDPNRMLIGTRSETYGSATILVADGAVKKIGTRFGYSAWHPSGQTAAYSINRVRQFFHSATAEVRDVIDLDSALGYYLVRTGNVKLVPGAADKRRLETYPTWSPDGRYLYYCSAPMLWEDREEISRTRYAEVKYDLMRIDYDPDGGNWGELEAVLLSADTGMSITEPRVSPDGRFLLFCMCRYGCFPVFHPTSDLYMMDLDSGEYAPLDINSKFSESWHSWSSNGRWIAFASKRCDGVFGRIYFSYVDESGHAHRPLLLPQEAPTFYDSLIKTFSVPELAPFPAPVHSRILGRVIRGLGTRQGNDPASQTMRSGGHSQDF